MGNEYVINGAKMWITNGTVDGKETGDSIWYMQELVRRKVMSRCFWLRKACLGLAWGKRSMTNAVCVRL